MADARMLRTTVEITGTGDNGEPAILTASGKAIEFAGYLRAYVEGSDDPAAELDEQETLLPKLTVGEQSLRARQRRCAPRRGGRRSEGTSDESAAALHGSVARQAARGRRHRPSVDVCADRRHHSAARLCHASGQGARAELHGVRRDAAPARALRRLRGHRVHRRNGGNPRPDLQRRQGLAGFHPRVLPRRRQASRAREPGRGQGPGNRLSGDRGVQRSGERAAGPRADRPLRSIPPGRRLVERRPARVAPGRSRAGGSDVREGARADQGQGARSALARRGSGRPACRST